MLRPLLGRQPKITIRGEVFHQREGFDRRNWVRVVVADNGIGFDNRHAERIFAAFQRLHGRSEYEGSGIGLAICKKIIEHHGGIIYATGIPDDGAIFSIILPAR